jgi:hypothetical protein
VSTLSLGSTPRSTTSSISLPCCIVTDDWLLRVGICRLLREYIELEFNATLSHKLSFPSVLHRY